MFQRCGDGGLQISITLDIEGAVVGPTNAGLAIADALAKM
jgi:hypothetical protein